MSEAAELPAVIDAAIGVCLATSGHADFERFNYDVIDQRGDEFMVLETIEEIVAR